MDRSVSVGYGPDEKRRVLMNFGPLNKKGGERRLNVAITRARRRLEIVSLLRSDQIDLIRTAAVGVRHLKDFLRYAEEGPRSLAAGSDRSVAAGPGPPEREVLAELRRAGYDAVTGGGCGGYRVDIGVIDPAHPDRDLLGVELDGPAYRSAKTAREQIGSSIAFAGQTQQQVGREGEPSRPSGVLGRLRWRMAGVREGAVSAALANF